ncbi:hypothetical protein BJ138DRAFT_1130846 [Hygrophoropsis aurantiaca]|uniref:Uncharacterized protein n=1 Tax=Hygrophoropsis aurantiaca TaxID=72124 RepID=A0ACB7ZVG3_9AGAM|nr:hypothetical protein BJ138DRAFT_1130846 [Hygrophoropsis aurantiaca]
MTTRHASHDDGGPPTKKLKETPSKQASSSTAGSSTTELDSNSNEAAKLSTSTHLVGFDDNVKRRVKFCEMFAGEDALTYSIDVMPSTMTWGPKEAYKNLSDTICAGPPGEKKPVTLWIVGQATNVYYMKSSTEYADQANIRILPTILSSGKKVSDMMTKLSNPPSNADETGGGVLRVSVWQSKFINGAKAEPIPFSEVYDAREGYKDKSEMPVLSLGDIKQRDLILIECSMKRFSTERKRYQTWDKWRAFLNLKAVSLIATAPELPRDIGGLSTPSVTF